MNRRRNWPALVAVRRSAARRGVGRRQAARGGRTAARHAVALDGQARVDVLVDGKPFTAYIWPATLKKPTLYPIRAAAGSSSRAVSRPGPASAPIIRTTSASGSTTAT